MVAAIQCAIEERTEGEEVPVLLSSEDYRGACSLSSYCSSVVEVAYFSLTGSGN